MVIIKSGTNIDKSCINKLFVFDDITPEAEIVAKLEELAKELDLFNPETQLTIATNRDLVIWALRVLALESGNFDQLRIEYDNVDGTKFVHQLDDRGNLVGDFDGFRTENFKLMMRAADYVLNRSRGEETC